MKRREFFKNTSLAALTASLVSPLEFFGTTKAPQDKKQKGRAKNIIFMVSDGMSVGTLTMAGLLLQRKDGRQSHWLNLFSQEGVKRALMDTASASSLVTDSAAASSSWGCGFRVNNGSLNVGADGQEYKPILQKFKGAGKAVGCVTTVPVTHATPAGFCINNNKRGDQGEIALQYLPLKFDVMLGGGLEYFDGDLRKDKRDLLTEFSKADYHVVKNRSELMSKEGKMPLLGVFHEDGLPYELDRQQDRNLVEQVPSLAEMTATAIERLKKNAKGFVLQVEAGKVDWAAHANDAGALLYDQIAFDEAVKVALDFARQDKETLVIITTDHGNANPGLFSGSSANANFDRLQHFKHSNEWVLKKVDPTFNAARLIDHIEAAQGIAITTDEASSLLSHFKQGEGDGLYNPGKLPFRILAEIQQKYTNIGFGSMDHSGDYVEVSMFGPGSDLLKPFIKNTELHYLMLQAAEVQS